VDKGEWAEEARLGDDLIIRIHFNPKSSQERSILYA